MYDILLLSIIMSITGHCNIMLYNINQSLFPLKLSASSVFYLRYVDKYRDINCY